MLQCPDQEGRARTGKVSAFMAASGLVITSFGGVTVVSFRERSILDGPAVEAIGKDLFALVDEQAQRKIILDFAEVRHLTSSMLGVLVTLHQKSQKIKGRVILCGLQPKLMEIFKVTRLDSLLQFAQDEAEAFKQLK